MPIARVRPKGHHLVHLWSDGGWRACDSLEGRSPESTAADWSGSSTYGVNCPECLEAAGLGEDAARARAHEVLVGVVLVVIGAAIAALAVFAFIVKGA